jgi:hypothetical protein
MVCVFFAFIVAGCAATLDQRDAQSCPTSIPAPVLQAGESWTLQYAEGPWTRRLTSQSEDGLFEVAGEQGTRFYYDRTHTLRKVIRKGESVTRASVDFPLIGRPVLDFPLQPGKSWHYMIDARSTGGNLLVYRNTFSVVGCEQVRVPAGTFLAVVITEEQDVLGANARGSRTWWYAPEVKYFVKLTHGWASPGFWNQSDAVLLDYQIVPSVDAATSASPPTADTRTRPPVATLPAATAAPGEQGAISPSPPASTLAPVWERGYEWTYQWTSPQGSGTFVRTVEREETVAGVQHYVVRSGSRDIYYTKADLSWLMELVDGAVEARGTPPDRRFDWPLAVGKEWEATYTLENLREGTTETRSWRYRVDAVDMVTVPAGTFQAFHLTGKDSTGKLVREYWYAPDLKGLVKQRVFHPYGVENRELVEYTFKAMIAPAP